MLFFINDVIDEVELQAILEIKKKNKKNPEGKSRVQVCYLGASMSGRGVKDTRDVHLL